MSKRTRRNRSLNQPGFGTFAGLAVGVVLLNLVVIAAAIAVIVVVLRALGVIS